jgi:uncharacterized protein YjbI with pentapeptide repeats
MSASSYNSIVRPRVVSEITGEKLLLEDVLEPYLKSDRPGAVCILGEPGTGKSAALRHLASRIPKGSMVELQDDPDPARVTELSDRMLVIYSADKRGDFGHLAVFRLAPWDADECLEYLMAAHPDRCASVMRRVRATPPDDRPETPELWTVCLDLLAADESIVGCEAALRRHLDDRVRGPLRDQARNVSFERIVLPPLSTFDEVQLYGHSGFLGFLLGRGLAAEDIRFIRNPQVRMLLAVERLVEGEFYAAALQRRLPPEMIVKAGRAIARGDLVTEALKTHVREQSSQPMAASLLNAAAQGWKPDGDDLRWFQGAYLPRADWAGVTLTNAHFDGADLTEIHLRSSALTNASFRGATLRRADLRGSNLWGLDARKADLGGADLSLARAECGDFSEANLRGANMSAAQLQGARFVGAELAGAAFLQADLSGATFQSADMDYKEEERTRFDGVDFTLANLDRARLAGADLRNALLAGARFTGACLDGANLEHIEVPGAPFDEADLERALLTGSILTGASFRKAQLRHAKLADVQWENAILADADLRDVTFHMGSSRSGLVFGEPSEGTRGGFYSDEYFDQSYRPIEEIRTANLRGADLRGAILYGTDFYLVDLRDALISPDQEYWLRKCGAILESRV